MKRYALALLLLFPLLAACSGGPRTIAAREDFQSDSRHHREFAATATSACEAARRVLLGDGYVIATDSAEQKLNGVKEFQIGKDRQGILRVYVTCAPNAAGSIIFFTATEHHFDVKTSRQSTSVGVPLLPPLSVRSKSEVDNLVQTRGETVTDENFYEHFYRALQQELERRPNH